MRAFCEQALASMPAWQQSLLPAQPRLLLLQEPGRLASRPLLLWLATAAASTLEPHPISLHRHLPQPGLSVFETVTSCLFPTLVSARVGLSVFRHGLQRGPS